MKRARAKILSGLGILWLISSHTSVIADQLQDSSDALKKPVIQISNSGLAKNLWQIDRTSATMEKLHSLLPRSGGKLCHAISIAQVVLNFITADDYIRLPFPDLGELFVHKLRRTESRYGIVQWSGKVMAHDELTFSLYYNPVHRTYSSHISLGGQDTWVIRTVGDFTLICKHHQRHTRLHSPAPSDPR